jgi:hypothetical protein
MNSSSLDKKKGLTTSAASKTRSLGKLFENAHAASYGSTAL